MCTIKRDEEGMLVCAECTEHPAYWWTEHALSIMDKASPVDRARLGGDFFELVELAPGGWRLAELAKPEKSVNNTGNNRCLLSPAWKRKKCSWLVHSENPVCRNPRSFLPIQRAWRAHTQAS